MSQQFSLSHHVSMVESESGIVLLNMSTGKYWQVSQSGAYIIRLLLGGLSPVDIATRLSEQFIDLSIDQVLTDISQLTESLSNAGLVVAK